MVKRTERGWPGHFICAESCLFRRNTLLEGAGQTIVVSTVGLMRDPRHKNRFKLLGSDWYYETGAFHSKINDNRYHDADINREVSFKSPWAIKNLRDDDKANLMHETVVAEIIAKMKKGDEL